MNITNRIVKICRRIDYIEFMLACKNQKGLIAIDLKKELEQLDEELKTLTPAFDIDSYIKIATDDISKLRIRDVFRVLEAANEHGDTVLQAVEDYIIKHRPEFLNEVVQCMP